MGHVPAEQDDAAEESETALAVEMCSVEPPPRWDVRHGHACHDNRFQYTISSTNTIPIC